jgi:hypothetical protein
MGNSLRVLILAVLTALLTGCPKLGDGGGAPDVLGTWTGTFSGSAVSITGAIIAGGPGFIYGADGNLYAITGLQSRNPLAGGMFHLNQPLSVGACAMGADCTNRFALYGTGYQDGLVLSARDSPGLPEIPDPNGRQLLGFDLTRTEPYSGPLIFPGVPFPMSSGQWQGYYLPSGLSVVLDVKAGGAFTGTDAYGCTLSGAAEELGNFVISSFTHASSQNLFKVTVKGALGFESRKCGVSLTGVGYLSSTGTGPFKGVPGTYFYMGVYNPDAFGEVLQLDFDTGYMAVFKVQ